MPEKGAAACLSLYVARLSTDIPSGE